MFEIVSIIYLFFWLYENYYALLIFKNINLLNKGSIN